MNVRTAVLAIVAAALGLYLTACTSMTGQSAGQNLDDSIITSEVKTKLTSDKFVNMTRISVKTQGGVVYLTGAVGTDDERDNATGLAKNVSGVKKVVNLLEVRPELAKRDREANPPKEPEKPEPK